MGMIDGALNAGKSAFSAGSRVLHGINQVKTGIAAGQQVEQALQQRNKYDRRLNNPGMRPKITAPSITKYSSEQEDRMQKGKKKPLTKAQKIAIGTGASLGALALLNIAATGNVLGPMYSLGKGVEQAPKNIFQKGKSGAYGPGFAAAANGVEQAFRRTKVEPKDYYDAARMGFSFGGKQRKNTSFSSGSKTEGNTDKALSSFAQGFTMGAGILAAHLIGEKTLKDKSVKKSYNSNSFVNKDIENYRKTGNHPNKQYIEPAKKYVHSIKNDIDEYRDDKRKNIMTSIDEM